MSTKTPLNSFTSMLSSTVLCSNLEGGEFNSAMKNQKKKQEEDYLNAISWPPRSYRCNFCRREFRSAQALGGHMNVHRRDRAMLRQFSPSTDSHFTNLTLNLHHSPNPNLSSSYSAETKKLGSSDPFSLKVSEFKKSGTTVEEISCFGAEKIIKLNMEMISTVFTDSKGIDLELRLGYS